MNQTPALGLPAVIEAAVRRVKQAARQAAERTIDSLGVSALASANVFQRDALLGAQFELNRKLAVFCNGFDETLDRRVEREVLPRNSAQSALSETSWDALSLVDDHEIEVQVSAERFGLQIAQDCEAEQRELLAHARDRGIVEGRPEQEDAEICGVRGREGDESDGRRHDRDGGAPSDRSHRPTRLRASAAYAPVG